MVAARQGAHAFLLRRHGLYAWGDTLYEAERHVEILEFLFEAIGRGMSRGA
jgi:methylthioribulose-1-phosphate dehydratase